MRMKYSDAEIVQALRRVGRWASVSVAVVSGWLLFFVIVPFFLLGVYRVPEGDLITGKVHYADAFGFVAWLVNLGGILFFVYSRLFFLAWVLSLIDFILSRNWFVLALLIVAPLVVAYYFAGPYAFELNEWCVGG
jgi:hypothetical protein